MLKDAILEFTELRNKSNGPLVSNDVVDQNWYSPKIHILQHYPEWISWKGPLPLSSTDRGETWHKPLKQSFRSSNKGPQAMEFVLRDQDRQLAWKMWEKTLPPSERTPNIDDEWEEDEEEHLMNRASTPLCQEMEPSISVSVSGGRRWEKVRELGVVQEDLELERLVELTMTTIRHIQERGQFAVRVRRADVEERGAIFIKGHLGLTVKYPEVHDRKTMITEHILVTSSHAYGQDKAWTKPRFDTVLVRYDSQEGDDQMANRRVARILLLFSIQDLESAENRLSLAYVQLFRTVRPADKASGMFKVVKDRFEVIPIDTIERGVHLVPHFNGFGTKGATSKSEPGLEVYKEFWINNYVDMHMYNTIYSE